MTAALSLARTSGGGLKTVLRLQVGTDKLAGIFGGHVTIQVATLTATHGEKYPYSKPYPYWKKKYGLIGATFDNGGHRMNENSKVIVVEGNVGVGKTEFARHLAKEFDLKFFPSTPDSQCFMHEAYNYDVRGLDPILPKRARSYDLAKFYADKHPEKGTVGKLQLVWYEQKFYEYARALKHVLNTGQGVVMVRSVFGDSIYVDAMRRMGYVTAPFVKYYNQYRAASICELWKPHLTIYLDAPVSVLRERINKRNDPREVNSKVLSDAYLQAISDVYRDKYLPAVKQTGEVVEIDWTEKGNEMDLDVISEELQLYKLEAEDNEDNKFQDWSRLVEDDYTHMRLFLDDYDAQQALFIKPLPWDCPEVLMDQDTAIAYRQIVNYHPVFRYRPGWAPQLGHKAWCKLW